MIFFNRKFLVTKLVDRMGMRLDGPSLDNISKYKYKIRRVG